MYLSLIDVMYVSCLYFVYVICLCSPFLEENKIKYLSICLLVSCNDVNACRDEIDRLFIVHVWRRENSPNIILKHLNSKKICFNVSNAHLQMD